MPLRQDLELQQQPCVRPSESWLHLLPVSPAEHFQHGPEGACLKLTVNPLPFPAGFYWSTNNGKYCKD